MTDDAWTALWPFVITIVYQRFFVVRTTYRDERTVCIEIVSRGTTETGFHVVIELIGGMLLLEKIDFSIRAVNLLDM